VRTDSHDAAGKVVEVRPVGAIGRAQVEAVLASFRGPIEQIPPMYSALKWQGQRLYALARQGIDVERQPRRVQIFRLRLAQLSGERLSLEVECSSGTYLRVLADDIGSRLGCGAHLATLVRTAVGAFTLDHALTLEGFATAVREGTWPTCVISLAQAMATFPAIVVTSAAAQTLAHGRAPTAAQVVRVEGAFEVGQTVAIKELHGDLLAVGVATVRGTDLAATPAATAIMQLRRVLRHQP
jgi:tRNA pseudouridine55 synthase